ncbi:hypothetical protein FPV67DRAFT_1474079, partial [Lyophyllum atratum]
MPSLSLYTNTITTAVASISPIHSTPPPSAQATTSCKASVTAPEGREPKEWQGRQSGQTPAGGEPLGTSLYPLPVMPDCLETAPRSLNPPARRHVIRQRPTRPTTTTSTTISLNNPRARVPPEHHSPRPLLLARNPAVSPDDAQHGSQPWCYRRVTRRPQTRPRVPPHHQPQTATAHPQPRHVTQTCDDPRLLSYPKPRPRHLSVAMSRLPTVRRNRAHPLLLRRSSFSIPLPSNPAYSIVYTLSYTIYFLMYFLMYAIYL